MQNAYQANLLENVNDAIVAYDADLRVTSWNRRAEEQYGWTAEEALGGYAPDLLGSRVTEAERASVFSTLAETGRWQGEVRHTRREGTPLVVENSSMALRDEAGRIGGYVVANRDITARKEAEAQNARLVEELRISREHLRGLSQRLVTTQEAERSYVADQLYNQAAQVLCAVQFQLARLDKAGDALDDQFPAINATLNEAIRALHDLASELRPAILGSRGLRALESLLVEFGQDNGLAVQYDAGDTGLLRPPTGSNCRVYRA